MKNFMRWMGILVVLLGFTARGKAAEIFKNDDLDLNFGGRIQELGEMENVTDDAVRNHFRVYLWNVEDRLYTNGSFKDFKWTFEASFGGEDIANGTNGSFNLLDANVDIPFIKDLIYVKVGQFKDPANLESAIYDGNMLFTEKSPNFNLFFNEGYETGVALWGHLGILDGQAGLVQGAPNLPQRYLPELVNFPIPMFARVGLSDGISDDPFKPMQSGFTKPDKLQWAAHLMAYVAADSNAGHGDLFGQMGGALATFNDNSYYGNILLSSKFNPYLSVAGQNPVTANYGQGGLDFQVRAPMGDTVFTLSGQFMVGHYDVTVPTPSITALGTILGKPAVPGSHYELNIGGGELIASIGDKPFELAGRLAVVVPDNGLQGTSNNSTTFRPIFVNSNPIVEATFPSISLHFNENAKVVAETMFMFDEPEAQDTDGNYVVAEMPGSAAGTTYRAPNIRASFIPIGRMMFQFQF